jgi:hypothetical protein
MFGCGVWGDMSNTASTKQAHVRQVWILVFEHIPCANLRQYHPSPVSIKCKHCSHFFGNAPSYVQHLENNRCNISKHEMHIAVMHHESSDGDKTVGQFWSPTATNEYQPHRLHDRTTACVLGRIPAASK